MSGRKAEFGHARRAGAWLSGSPRVQRFAAAHVGVLLAAGIGCLTARNPPPTSGQPLAMAAAVGPVAAVDLPAPDPTHAQVSRTASRPRPRHTRTTAPRGWDFWASRIRGCESHGRPDAPADYQAENPSTTASGAYQILDTTWGGRFGVSHAADASPAEQEVVAAELYGRHGLSDWLSSAACWRPPSDHDSRSAAVS
jgi:hypothetical protein